MRWLFAIAYLLLLLFVVAMLIRLVFDWVQVFARDWKPRGIALVVAEAVYTVTDPPLRWLRRRIRPIRIGGVALDLAFLIVMFACSIGLAVLSSLIARFS
ncbi:MAG TPA: YggT family protein [Actinotalea caeni]|uniref:YggT family protein n=1 Tax=Actinotalea caeni TaxID=1348467 RepID=UPI0012E12F14|nr:YggT family protein [Actinotalea caeni]HLV56635.1 YggT family protein [Actinotalea caeni]